MILAFIAVGLVSFFGGFATCYKMMEIAKKHDNAPSRGEIIGSTEHISKTGSKMPTMEELLVTMPEAINVTSLDPSELETYMVCLNERRSNLTGVVDRQRRSDETTIKMRIINTNN